MSSSRNPDLKSRSWRVPESLAIRLKVVAAQTGRSAESIVVEALTRYLDDQDAAREADCRTFAEVG